MKDKAKVILEGEEKNNKITMKASYEGCANTQLHVLLTAACSVATKYGVDCNELIAFLKEAYKVVLKNGK